MAAVTRGYSMAAARCRTEKGFARRAPVRAAYEAAVERQRATERNEAAERERDDRRKLEERVLALENRLRLPR